MTANSKNYADVWKEIPWKSLEKALSILQHRIYKASKNNQIAKVKQLQRLLLYSKTSKLLAVREITQLNTEKRIADVNSLFLLNARQKLELADSIRIHPSEEYFRLNRTCKFKPNQSKLSLEVSIIRDRVTKCILKYALAPMYAAKGSLDSFGFQLGTDQSDVQSAIIMNIKNDSTKISKKVLKINLKRCFSEVKDFKFLNLITLPSFAMKVLKQILKVGIFREKCKSVKDPFQCEIMSPLLINIILQGLEDIYNDHTKPNAVIQKGIRYLDELVFFPKGKESSEILIQKVKTFLTERGLNAENSKIWILEVTSGFDFLEWSFKLKPKSGKYLCYPTSKSRKNCIKNLKRIIKDSRYKLRDRLKKANFIYENWHEYYKRCNTSNTNVWSIKRFYYRYIQRKSSVPQKEHLKLINSVFTIN